MGRGDNHRSNGEFFVKLESRRRECKADIAGGWQEERMPEATSIGLNYYIVPGMEDVGPIYRTDADLAEAVRVKFTPMTEGRDGFQTSGAEAAVDWLESGPLAFIKAVREVIENG